MNRIYAYLRASTKEQNAERAHHLLETFAHDHKQKISGWFVEHESGATLKRPELFRLLDIAQKGDLLLVEQVDRISRLTNQDWETLKARIKNKGIIIVALDLPTSHQFMNSNNDDFTMRMIEAINTMMLDMLAAIARKDYEDRRKRQAQGIKKAKAEGKYKGRPQNITLRKNIAALLRDGYSIKQVTKNLKCSNKTVIKVKKEIATL